MVRRSSPESYFGWSPPDGPVPEKPSKAKKKGQRAKENSVSPTESEPGRLPPDPEKAKRLGSLLVEREPDAAATRPKKKGRRKRSEPAAEGLPETESIDEVKAAQHDTPVKPEQTDPSALGKLETDTAKDRAGKGDQLQADARKAARQSAETDWPAGLPKELSLSALPGGEFYTIDLGPKGPIPERQEMFDARSEAASVNPEEAPEELPTTTLNAAELLPEMRAERSSQSVPTHSALEGGSDRAEEVDHFQTPTRSLPPDRHPTAPEIPYYYAEAVPPPPEPLERGVPPVLPPAFERPADHPMVSLNEWHERQPEPAQEYHRPAAAGGVDRHVSHAVSASERAASKRDVQNAVHRAAGTANRSGLFTGILVAGVYEHFKHKRRERRVEKRFKQQARQLRQSREDQHFTATEHAKQQAESERKLSSAEQRFVTAERATVAREEHTKQQFAALRQAVAKRQKTVERANPEVSERPLVVPSEHWIQPEGSFITEMDKHTRLPVKPEQRTFAYGREYYRERAHETASATRRTITAGEVALKGASAVHVQRTASSSGVAPAARQRTTDVATSGPLGTRRSKGLGDLKPHSPSTTAGPIWPYVLILVVIFICLAVLIH